MCFCGVYVCAYCIHMIESRCLGAEEKVNEGSIKNGKKNPKTYTVTECTEKNHQSIRKWDDIVELPILTHSQNKHYQYQQLRQFYRRLSRITCNACALFSNDSKVWW